MGLYNYFSHVRDHKALCVCVYMCAWGGDWGATSYQENGAKETEAGDRKSEEEAAPTAPAQHCSYSNRQQGGKSAERLRVQLKMTRSQECEIVSRQS